MEKIDLGFVVLHYNNFDDTVECVQSIISNLDTISYRILVFDNCSPNGSGALLKEKFKDLEFVETYLNDQNLGFGGGNNKGISILKSKYEVKYLVLSNNDIVLVDKEF